MRQKRAKTYRKLMEMYQETFGFHTPFQILFDSNFCQEGYRIALLHQKNVKRLMSGVVQDECKLMITQCCIAELYKLDKADQPIIDMAKTFERNKCNHKPAIAGAECIKTIIGTKNKNRYVVATQSDTLRTHLHTIPAAPIVHIKRGVLVLEPPSEETLKIKSDAEEQALRARKGEVPIDESATERPAKKIRGPKGPNPLSVLKKKPKAPLTPKPKPNPDPESGRKRKRNAEEGRDAQDGDASPAKRKRKRRRGAAHTEDGAEEPVASEET